MTKKIPKISIKVAKEIIDLVKDFAPEYYDKGLIRLQYDNDNKSVFEAYYYTNGKWVSDDDFMITNEELEKYPELQDEYNKLYNLWNNQNDKIDELLHRVSPISKNDQFRFITISFNKDNIHIDTKIGWDYTYHRYWYYKYLKDYPQFLINYAIISKE